METDYYNINDFIDNMRKAYFDMHEMPSSSEYLRKQLIKAVTGSANDVAEVKDTLLKGEWLSADWVPQTAKEAFIRVINTRQMPGKEQMKEYIKNIGPLVFPGDYFKTKTIASVDLSKLYEMADNGVLTDKNAYFLLNKALNVARSRETEKKEEADNTAQRRGVPTERIIEDATRESLTEQRTIYKKMTNLPQVSNWDLLEYAHRLDRNAPGWREQIDQIINQMQDKLDTEVKNITPQYDKSKIRKIFDEHSYILTLLYWLRDSSDSKNRASINKDISEIKEKYDVDKFLGKMREEKLNKINAATAQMASQQTEPSMQMMSPQIERN